MRIRHTGTAPLCDSLNECAGVAKVALALFLLRRNKESIKHSESDSRYSESIFQYSKSICRFVIFISKNLEGEGKRVNFAACKYKNEIEICHRLNMLQSKMLHERC